MIVSIYRNAANISSTFGRNVSIAMFSTTCHRQTKQSSNILGSDDLPIISPQALAHLINVSRAPIDSTPRVVLLDASWFLPNDAKKRTGEAAYSSLRISNDARFFDLDAVKSHTSPYPHMLPDAETFAEAMKKLRVRRKDAVVVYEGPDMGIFSAPRVAWMLRVFGHPKVMILNNFKSWIKEGYSTESGKPIETDREVKLEDEYPLVQPDLDLVASFEEVHEIAKKQKSMAKEDLHVQILDARPRGRFLGTDPEPRPGLSSGHIPNSLSVPFNILLDPETKEFLPKPLLRQVLLDAGVSDDPKVQKISSCGTGVTAAIVDTALQVAGFGDTPETKRKVYDGSWTEWAQRVKDEEGMIVTNTKS